MLHYVTVLELMFLEFGVAWAILYYGIAVTRDHRKRRRFSDATRHLGHADLKDGFDRNMRVVASFLRSTRRNALDAKKAESALVMATALREHLAVIEGLRPLPKYLKSRRTIWRQARQLNRQ